MRPGEMVRLRCEWWSPPSLPVRGDHLRTQAGACYRVERVDQEGSTFIFECVRLEKNAVAAGDAGVFEWEMTRG